MALTTHRYSGGRLEERDFDPTRIDRILRDGDVVWLDIAEPTQADMDLLREEFGFHELALEDCLHPHQRPKIEQYEGYFFLVAYGASQVDGSMVEHEIAAFVGHNFLVTVRKGPVPYDLTTARRRWDAHSELAAEGGGYLLYVLLDQVVDGYFGVLDFYEDRGEEIEDRVFEGEVDAALQARIFELKKDLVTFRRRVAPLRDVLDVLQRRLVDVVTERLEPYYRDVYDHVLRATDFIDGLRDLLSSALEASLAVTSNRLNDAMKRLTAWAAIILIPSLIAGIYGMNFQHMPELGWLWGYPFALGVMGLTAGALYLAFKHRDWL